MPRLLIISAHFPPVNAPDMQRVRMSLPHFVDAGWEVVVLTVNDQHPMAPLEPALLSTIPPAVRIVRASVLSRKWTRYLGMNNLGLRTLPFLYEAGCELLTTSRFDLVYFSTTQFILCPLGRVWLREFGVPYVIDLQDPWVNDYYYRPGAPRPPGGWKYMLTYHAAKVLERWTLARCAHVISVSSAYIDSLRKRYDWFIGQQATVLTFGAPDADFQLVRQRAAARILPSTATLKIAYAGRLGPDMLPALDVLLGALRLLADAPRPVELFFYGTSYARAGEGESTTTALAARHGVTHLVHEHPARIGYLESLQLLLETDVALMLGSEDRAYSPSKVYPTLLAGRPALAIAPRDSILEAKIHELGGASLITFDAASKEAATVILAESLRQYLSTGLDPEALPVNLERLERDYTAAAISAQQLRIFNQLIHATNPVPEAINLAEYWPDLNTQEERK